MKIFNGKKEADKILGDLRKKIKKEKTKPKLAVILVGDNPASKIYIKIKKKVGKKIGISVSVYKFKKRTKEKDVINKILSLNKNKLVSGIIVQLPLPKGFNTDKIIKAIDLKKDVDGFNKANRDLLKKGKSYFFPVLPQAIFIALKGLRKKKVLALVNSDVFGRSLKGFFKVKGVKLEYILKKEFTPLKIKSADVVITVCGSPNLIKGEMVKKGVALIDAGTSSFKGNLVGDVDRESVKKKASFLTPVPGGIGPLTVASLLRNVYLAKKLWKT